MRDLELASRVPTKIKDDGADKLFNASLTLSKAFTLFTLIIHGKNLPIEKVRDEPHRLILLRSAAPYCLSKETLDTILGADRDEMNAYLIGLSKNAQQVIRYQLYGLAGNYMNEKVFTPRDVYPADDVKLHLGLTGDNARKCFMEL
jgi:antitoxin component of RelBE/YafQ-DinJ toxin-antitoxin module